MLSACGYSLFKVDVAANVEKTTAADLSANTLALPQERVGSA
jgi:hypothetical protein